MKYHCVRKITATRKMKFDIKMEGYKVHLINHAVFVKDHDENIYLVREDYPFPLALLADVPIDPTCKYVRIKDRDNYKQVVGGYMIKSTGELIYSSHRHDMAWDKTRSFFVDGGLEYVRTNVMNDEKAVRVKIDLFNQTFVIAEDYGDEKTIPFKFTRFVK